MTEPDEKTRQMNPTIYGKLPRQYYRYALQWCSDPKWSLEETANLLAGCVPHRKMFMKGADHRMLDEAVLAMENRIRAAVGKSLMPIRTRKYFGRTYLDGRTVIRWALDEGIIVPADLLRAEREIRRTWPRTGYTTPCLEAAQWVVTNFWEKAHPRRPPTSGKIIAALLEQFPELSGADCDLVEKVTRPPYLRDDPT